MYSPVASKPSAHRGESDSESSTHSYRDRIREEKRQRRLRTRANPKDTQGYSSADGSGEEELELAPTPPPPAEGDAFRVALIESQLSAQAAAAEFPSLAPPSPDEEEKARAIEELRNDNMDPFDAVDQGYVSPSTAVAVILEGEYDTPPKSPEDPDW